MAQNILITGAAGFIGGSVLADLISREDEGFENARYFAAVRTQQQVQCLSKLRATIIQLDVTDKVSVEEVIIQNEINIIIHTASAVDARMASNLISALGKRKKLSGKDVYYIHSSVATVFSEEGGWPYGRVKDNDAILEKEKELGDLHPVRKTNILVAEQGKAEGVTTLLVAIPVVYGRGSGEWRKLSVNIPALVRTSIKLKNVYKFEKNGSPPAVHISDLSALYVLLLESILKKQDIPNGEDGYYFATVHRLPWWRVMQGLAEALHSRGLVESADVKTWPSYDTAADELGFPRMYMRAIGTSSGDLVPVNAYNLGWKPKWDEEKFLNSLDDEVQAVQELDTVKMSLFDTMITK